MTQCFDALLDDDIYVLELSGCLNLFGILQSLFWLNKCNVGLFYKGKCILGQQQSKIRIRSLVKEQTLSNETDNLAVSARTWVIRSWKKGQSVPLMVKVEDEPQLQTNHPNLIPAFATYNYCLSMLQSQEAANLVGIFASAYVEESVNSPAYFEKFEEKKLATFIRQPFFQRRKSTYSSLLGKLGWESKFEIWLETAKLIHQAFMSRLRLSKLPSSFELEYEMRRYFEIYQRKENVKGGLSLFLRLTFSVASHALTYLFIHSAPEQNLSRSSNANEARGAILFFDTRRSFSEFWKSQKPYPHSILDLRFDIPSFRRAIIRSALCLRTLPQTSEVPVAVCASGRTAILSPLLYHDIAEEGIFDVHLLSGVIRFQGSIFNAVTEEPEDVADNMSPNEIFQNLQLFKVDRRWKISHYISIDDTNLVMRTTIGMPDPTAQQWTVHYSRCIRVIAISPVVTQYWTGRPPAASNSVMWWDGNSPLERLRAMLRLHVQSILGPLLMERGEENYAQCYPTERFPFLTLSNREPLSPEVRFFSSLSLFVPLDCFLVIQGNVSVADCHSFAFDRLLDQLPDNEYLGRNLNSKELLKRRLGGLVKTRTLRPWDQEEPLQDWARQWICQMRCWRVVGKLKD